MKALTCEMCGSSNLIKEDGVFVCQSCGTKYSVEEAKKMMVSGTVKIDNTDELRNLYEIARRAKDADNSENAAKYYDMILVKDPSSWEANFYAVYYKAMNCAAEQISSAGNNISKCLSSVVDLVENNVPEEERGEILEEIQSRCSNIANILSSAAEKAFLGIDLSIRNSTHIKDFGDRVLSATMIVHTFGDILEERYNGEYGIMSAKLWKDGIQIMQSYTEQAPVDSSDLQKTVNEYGNKVKKYEPSYNTPTLLSRTFAGTRQGYICSICGYIYEGDWAPEKCPICKAPGSKFQMTEISATSSTSSSTGGSGGCYIATAVYGSYDCPEVWTLRRFRDYTLDETWYGRLFIKVYYATSPSFVKHFGNANLFKSWGKGLLDKFVTKLNNKGYDNTPYNDRY